MVRSPQTSVIAFTSQFGSFPEHVQSNTMPAHHLLCNVESTVCSKQTHLVMDNFLNVSVLRLSILLLRT